MSSKLKLNSQSGGSVSLTVDDTLTTDEEVNLSELDTVESGSNANGNWVKFPDGTLMQYRITSITGSKDVYFPISFIDTDYAFAATAKAASGKSITLGGNIYENYINISVFNLDGSSPTYALDILWQATGRWKA